MAIFQVDTLFYEFNVAKYVKNKYITFSCLTSYGVELKQKYHIVNFTKDTLILVPDGEDIFELCEPNKRGQSVFVNSMLTYKFVKLHYEVSSDIVEFGYEIEPNRLKSISTLDIDSTRKVKIVIKDEYSNEPRIYKSLVSKKEYEHLIKILSSVNLDSYPDEKINKNAKRYSVLVIQYNDQKKIFKGSTPFFYSKLRDFIWEYIALINGGDVIKVRR
jgi:phage anti-repressor protein